MVSRNAQKNKGAAFPNLNEKQKAQKLNGFERINGDGDGCPDRPKRIGWLSNIIIKNEATSTFQYR